MLISIIVPVYNVEKYLRRCLQSISEQTYREIEVILVDDGSTDKCGIMCDDFAKQDNRVKVIHKENGGLSSARNVGTDIATGEYITYLDSDDYLARNYIQRSLELCDSYNAEISILDELYIPENMNDETITVKNEEVRLFTAEGAIEASLYQTPFGCDVSKLYKSDIAKSVRFPEGRLSEDLATCHLFFSKASKIVYSNEIGCYYRQREGSIMHNFNPKRMDALEWVHAIEAFCDANGLIIQNAAKCRIFNVSVHLLLDLPTSSELYDKFYPELWSEIKRTRWTVLKDKKARSREKAAAMLTYCGEGMLRRAWNSRFAVKKNTNTN